MDNTAPPPQPAPKNIVDLGRIKIGSCARYPALAPVEIADSGRIKVGSCARYPAEHNA